MARSVLTPKLDDEFSRESARVYWKRVLPLDKINYRDKTGRARVIDFNDRYLADVQNALTQGALDNRTSAPFVLADKDNAHTMDPERYRGDVTSLVREHELPEGIKAAVIEREGKLPQGLYARTEFASKKLAKAVVNNPRLPVSMRLREDVERSDGKKFAAMPIHVLGTMDPKIPGLGDWIPATADLSEYAADDVLDLSDESYTEATVAKKNKSDKDVSLAGGAATLEVPTLDKIEELWGSDVEQWDDDKLNAFLAQYAPEDKTDDDTDQDDGDDGEDADDDDGDEGDTSMSGNGEKDIALAEAQEARREARSALKSAAEIKWSATRAATLRKGVPPWVLDLAEPVLMRPNDTVLDLSEFEDEDDINITQIVQKLVAGYEGTIDFSEQEGHGGSDDSDPEKSVREDFAKMTADL